MDSPPPVPPVPPIDAGPVLHFDDGIPGFAHARRFVLSELTDDGTFQLLTCVDVADLSMVVAVPWLFFPEYAPDLPEPDRSGLGLQAPEDAIVFCSVTVDEEDDGLVVNLRAPFIANARTRAARQVILHDDLPLRAPVSAGA